MDITANRMKVQFGEVSVDLQTGELCHSGRAKPIFLAEQPLQVLQMLLKLPGEMVSRDELIRALWPAGGFGDFDHGLNKVVNRLRDLLGDSADSPKFIQTVARRGYRFIAPVTTGRATPVVASAADIASLAVLPLFNATGDPETEYLSDGISESVINLLSQLPNLRVIPRTSAFRYRGREVDLKEVGRDLHVRTVLTGKLIRRGDELVVQAELVDVANLTQFWGGRFSKKLEDIFEVQEELARKISENLRLRPTQEVSRRLAERPTQNREAHEMLLKARFHMNKWTPEGFQRGMAYARQAIEADPQFAQAHAMLSGVCSAFGTFGLLPPSETYPKAKAAALRALEIDDSISDARAVLAHIAIYYEWDWAGAQRECNEAIRLNPSSPWGHSYWSDWLLIVGRQEESLAEARLAMQLDPLSVPHLTRFGQKLCYARDYDRAVEYLQKALELDPNFAFAHVFLAQAYAWKGSFEESLAACEKVASLFGDNAYSKALRSLILAMASGTDEAKALLNELKRRPKLDSMTLIPLAETHCVLGERDEAFELLEAAYQVRATILIFLAVQPTFDNIRSDPRFADLLRRIGLPHVSLPHAG